MCDKLLNMDHRQGIRCNRSIADIFDIIVHRIIPNAMLVIAGNRHTLP